MDQYNEFSVQNLLTVIKDLIWRFHTKPIAKSEIETLSKFDDKLVAWKRLTTILFDSRSDIDVLGEVAYRLSWHFPSPPDERAMYFIDRISHASDLELVNIVGAIQGALERDRDDVSKLTAELFKYLPNQIERLKSLARGHLVPEEWLEGLFQSVELCTQEFEDDFRDEIKLIYRIEDCDQLE